MARECWLLPRSPCHGRNQKRLPNRRRPACREAAGRAVGVCQFELGIVDLIDFKEFWKKYFSTNRRLRIVGESLGKESAVDLLVELGAYEILWESRSPKNVSSDTLSLKLAMLFATARTRPQTFRSRDALRPASVLWTICRSPRSRHTRRQWLPRRLTLGAGIFQIPQHAVDIVPFARIDRKSVTSGKRPTCALIRLDALKVMSCVNIMRPRFQRWLLLRADRASRSFPDWNSEPLT